MDFVEHLKAYLSDEEIKNLLDSLDKESQHAVLLNTKKMSDEMFLSLFPKVTPHPIVKHAYLYNKDEYDLGKSVFHLLGCFYLQEPSAMVPAYLLSPQEDEIVLDMCAAPGGKTIQASILMNGAGLIIANDLSRPRCSTLVENIERLGLGNVTVTNNDLSKIAANYQNKFDRIILDAPCSGSGMFRKEAKMKDDWSYNKVLKFQEVQKQLILLAFDMLEKGGTLCYSTCSFSKEEDEDVISYLLEKREAELIQFSHNLVYFNKQKPLGFHLLPSIFPGEGHYVCLIRKPGKLIKNNSVIKEKEFFEIKRYGDTLFGVNYPFTYKGFNIVREGVKIGEKIKNEIKYDYHYGHYTSRFEKVYELNDDDLIKYLSGNVITKNIDKGHYLLRYKGINVDITNSDGRMIKNHFPKGLRVQIKKVF